MATGNLNPNHYPAQRAAKVVQHYLNTHYGSPYRMIELHSVQNGKAEDVTFGRKYQLEISVKDLGNNKTEKCSAEVLFPNAEQELGHPQVQASCEGLTNINNTEQEEAFFQKYRTNPYLVSAPLPDNFGRIEPDMEPLWHLGMVASSFIMLQESTENSLYNMAQVAGFTQLKTEEEQLKFDYNILLHDMISQEILAWKLLFTWSPQEGVRVLNMQQVPYSHEENPFQTK